jgi:hypothetical protein
MGAVRTDEFRKDAVRIALSSGLHVNRLLMIWEAACRR